MKSLIARGVALAMLLLGAAGATERRPVKIAIFADLSSVYSQTGGEGAIEAARMAIEDFGAAAGGPVEFVFADPQNSAERGATIAREWYAEGVDVIADVPNSAVALAVQQVSREAKKNVLFSSPASDDLTGPNCSPYSVHWTYDTYAMAHGTAQAIMNSGGDSWFFITADYAFGDAMQRDAVDVIRSQGGIILGSARAALGTIDFSQYLLQAKTSRAKVVGLAIAGKDMINAIREANEFSVVQDGQRLVGLLVFISDVHSLGLAISQGLRLTSAYYWDQNEATRAWAKRFFRKTERMPTSVQAGVYGALAHYLKAVKAVGGVDAEAVMAKMRETPINDFMTRDGKLRIDGRVMRDMYLFEAKAPAESKYLWDYLKQLQTIPADIAYRPLSEGGCPLAAPR